MDSESKNEKGLEALDDEVLAAIVEADVLENGEITKDEACVAFDELERRSRR